MSHPTTFLEYITQRSGFGRTSWTQTAVILLAVVGFAFMCAGMRDWGAGWWVPGAFSAAIFIGFIGGTWGNWTQDRRRWKQPPVNNHYRDLCEGCDPVRMADGKPVTSLTKWYAWRHKITREAAEAELRHTSVYRTAVDEHERYLNAILRR